MDSLCSILGVFFHFTLLFSLPAKYLEYKYKNINKINNKRNKVNEGTAAFRTHTHIMYVMLQQQQT